MKTLLITTLLLIFTANTGFAQEKQNDATWEETVEWIRTYGMPYGFDNYTKNKIGNWFTNVNEDKKTLTIVEAKVVPDAFCDLLVERNKRYSCSTSGEYGYISTYSNEVNEIRYEVSKSYYYIAFKSPESISRVYFNKDDKKTFERCKKAFEHLFYLMSNEVTITDKTDLENKF